MEETRKAAISLEQWEQAKDYLTRSIKNGGDDITARILRAKVNAELGDSAAAALDVKVARGFDASDPRLKEFPIGIPPDTVVAELDALIVESPRDPRRWEARATERTRLRRFKPALEDIEKARNLDFDSTRLMIDQGHLLWQLELPIPKELEISPSEAWTRDEAKFSAAFEAMQPDLDALTVLDAKLKAAPQAALYRERSALLNRLHQKALAEKDTQKAMEPEPQPQAPARP